MGSDSLDKNFDVLAERFARRVYGGLKGEIRLAVLRRDIQRLIPQGSSLQVIDIGCGMAQLAIELATQGQHVVASDVSKNMLELARAAAERAGVEAAIDWQHTAYQSLDLPQKFDLLLCHALLEWVDDPEAIVIAAARMLKPGGVLSLCFYNPAGKIYRNLIRGNFDWLDQREQYVSNSGSLTPNQPCLPEQVESWLAASNFSIESYSGVRVFHDYVVEKRGGLVDPGQILARELEFSGVDPYRRMGRYLHICARRA